eukprot:364799-Chlamydomonas_euryale.AAC.5
MLGNHGSLGPTLCQCMHGHCHTWRSHTSRPEQGFEGPGLRSCRRMGAATHCVATLHGPNTDLRV